MGHAVSSITDPAAHLGWYWGELKAGERLETTFLICDRKAMGVDENNKLK